jgi:hypothetical protein
MAMASAENYRREAARMNMDPGYLGGDDISAIMARIYAAPSHVVERAKKIMNP